jgi:hypothetical protein
LRHKIEANPLSAADKKVLSTTNERKVMSKTTFFKRIALTAIAALGFGMLSVAPSQAAAGVPTLTVATGSASVTMGASGETGTAAVVTVTGLMSAATDSYTITMVRKTFPASPIEATAFRMVYLETTTYDNTVVESGSGNTVITGLGARNLRQTVLESYTTTTGGIFAMDPGSTAGYVGARFGLMLDSQTAREGHEGTYVYTAIVTPYTSNVAGTPVSADVTFTINKTAIATALASGTIDPSKSTAVLNAEDGTASTTDEDVSVVATSATTTHATIRVKTFTSTSLAAPESFTVTVTGPGLVGDGTTFGKSVTFTGAGGVTDVEVRADGTAGTASIVVKTTSVTFPAKSVTFFTEEAATITLSVNQPVIKVGSNGTDVIRATALDADGNVWGGAAYIYASTAADALIAGSNATPAACTFNSTKGYHECPVSGVAKGTANLKVIDASTVALATATSGAAAVRVSTGVASSVVLSFDKATYAPGEKAQLRIKVLDAEGLAMPAATITNGFATGGITTTSQLGAAGASATDLANVSFALSGSTSAATDTNAGHKTYVVYMPATAGAITVKATGGAGIAATGRVALTATATVVDTSNDASIAAAEAASDAAAEAIDAANAATDAANLAAEAADAATVAAEEARDAADAATAAVEGSNHNLG